MKLNYPNANSLQYCATSPARLKLVGRRCLEVINVSPRAFNKPPRENFRHKKPGSVTKHMPGIPFDHPPLFLRIHFLQQFLSRYFQLLICSLCNPVGLVFYDDIWNRRAELFVFVSCFYKPSSSRQPYKGAIH